MPSAYELGQHGGKSRRGIWHSALWWRNHWDLRDRYGEYNDGSDLDGMSAGRRRLVRKLNAEHARHQAAKAAAGRPASVGNRARLRADLAEARRAQKLREEAQAMGYKAETAGFYGSGKVAAAEHSERRITTDQADHEARRLAEYEREQAEQYRERQRAARLVKKGRAA